MLQSFLNYGLSLLRVRRLFQKTMPPSVTSKIQHRIHRIKAYYATQIQIPEVVCNYYIYFSNFKEMYYLD